MKLHVVSDLHLPICPDGYGFSLPSVNADVLVLAGDCFSFVKKHRQKSIQWLQETAKRYEQVLYVYGNHEFYYTRLLSLHLDSFIQDLEGEMPNLRILVPERAITLGSRRFLGGTGFQRNSMEVPIISDHSSIKDFYQAQSHFEKLYRHLDDNLQNEDVVITHHAPSYGSLHPDFQGDPLNHWFITPEFQKLITKHQPKLWIHGHTHNHFDYKLGRTRVLCNARGYPGENTDFQPDFVLEI